MMCCHYITKSGEYYVGSCYLINIPILQNSIIGNYMKNINVYMYIVYVYKVGMSN